MTRLYRLHGGSITLSINKSHVAHIIRVRRALCIGEGFRVERKA